MVKRTWRIRDRSKGLTYVPASFTPPTPPPPSKAFVQGNIHQNGAVSSTTVAVALAAPVGAGNSLCVALGVGNDGTDIVSATDDKGNTYTLVGQTISGTAYTLYVLYAIGLVNSPQTVTITMNNAELFATGIVDEFSGLSSFDNSSFLRQVNPGPGTDATTSGTYTTAGNGELLWGVGISTVAGLGIATGTGFTVGGTNNVAGTFTTEYQVQAAASASTAATFTDTGGAADTTVTASMAFA